MAKKQAAGQLGDWLEDVPDSVQDAADEFDKTHTAKSKADAKLNTAKQSLIDQMRKHGVPRVRIRNGAKFLEISATDKITYKKPAEEPQDAE